MTSIQPPLGTKLLQNIYIPHITYDVILIDRLRKTMWWNEMRSRVILGSVCLLVVIIMISNNYTSFFIILLTQIITTDFIFYTIKSTVWLAVKYRQ